MTIKKMNKPQVCALWDLVLLGKLEREISGHDYPGKNWPSHDSRTVLSLVKRGYAQVVETFKYGYPKKAIPTDLGRELCDSKIIQ